MKLTIILCTCISLIIGAYYYYESKRANTSTPSLVYDGVTWPRGSDYQTSSDGDIIIELQKKFSAFEGEWEKGTKFFFDGNKLRRIETRGTFNFFQIFFSSEGSIDIENFPPNTLYKLKLKKKITIDGLDVKPECKINFKNSILYSAQCPEFGIVYFKRFIELPQTH